MNTESLPGFWLSPGAFIPETGNCALRLLGNPKPGNYPAAGATFQLAIATATPVVLSRPAGVDVRFDFPADGPAYSSEATCDCAGRISTELKPSPEKGSKELVFLACVKDNRPPRISGQEFNPVLRITFNNGLGFNIIIRFTQITQDAVEYTQSVKT